MAARPLTLLLLTGGLFACNGGTPSGPVGPPPPPPPSFEISTLLTVYPSSEENALFTRGTTTEERIGRILLGLEDLGTALGSTNLANEGNPQKLQDAIDRLRRQFQEADYRSAFDETRTNLERYLNDADNDGWSIDGRHGRDWPFDNEGPAPGNEPDGWAAQMVVTVKKLR